MLYEWKEHALLAAKKMAANVEELLENGTEYSLNLIVSQSFSHLLW